MNTCIYTLVTVTSKSVSWCTMCYMISCTLHLPSITLNSIFGFWAQVHIILYSNYYTIWWPKHNYSTMQCAMAGIEALKSRWYNNIYGSVRLHAGKALTKPWTGLDSNDIFKCQVFQTEITFLRLEGMASSFYNAIIYEICLWWKSLTDGSGTFNSLKFTDFSRIMSHVSEF